MSGGLQARRRVAVTLSAEMRLALEVLAERSGLPASAQAMVLLRQSLDRTIQSQEVQRRLGSHRKQRNLATWQEDQVVERAVELAAQESRAAQEPAWERDTTGTFAVPEERTRGE